MRSPSVNCQVGSFLKIFFNSLVNVFSFSFFIASPHHPIFGITINRNSGLPIFIASDHDLFDGCLGSGLEASICCLICQLELLSTVSSPTSTPTSIEPTTLFPATHFATFSSSPPITFRLPIVAKSCLREPFQWQATRWHYVVDPFSTNRINGVRCFRACSHQARPVSSTSTPSLCVSSRLCVSPRAMHQGNLASPGLTNTW